MRWEEDSNLCSRSILVRRSEMRRHGTQGPRHSCTVRVFVPVLLAAFFAGFFAS